WPMVALLLVILTLVALVAPGVRQLELGDDTARNLGIHTNWIRASSVIVGVALTALVTAAAGPISFIALAAPQIARRLVGGTGLRVSAESMTTPNPFNPFHGPQPVLAPVPAVSAIEVEHVRVGYDKHVISHDISISVPAGDYTAIIGPNACGKSTLLRAIARI